MRRVRGREKDVRREEEGRRRKRERVRFEPLSSEVLSLQEARREKGTREEWCDDSRTAKGQGKQKNWNKLKQLLNEELKTKGWKKRNYREARFCEELDRALSRE